MEESKTSPGLLEHYGRYNNMLRNGLCIETFETVSARGNPTPEYEAEVE